MLLDTSGLLCFLNRKEANFQRAKQFFEHAPQRLTHNYVIAELFPLCRTRHVPISLALQFMRQLLLDPTVKVIFVDRALNERALQLLAERGDKDWSLCDAVSFALMRDHGLTEALTTDHHFEQAGFVRLLKP